MAVNENLPKNFVQICESLVYMVDMNNGATHAGLKLGRAGEFGLIENSVYGEKADIKLPGEATNGLSNAIFRQGSLCRSCSRGLQPGLKVDSEEDDEIYQYRLQRQQQYGP